MKDIFYALTRKTLEFKIGALLYHIAVIVKIFHRGPFESYS